LPATLAVGAADPFGLASLVVGGGGVGAEDGGATALVAVTGGGASFVRAAGSPFGDRAFTTPKTTIAAITAAAPAKNGQRRDRIAAASASVDVPSGFVSMTVAFGCDGGGMLRAPVVLARSAAAAMASTTIFVSIGVLSDFIMRARARSESMRGTTSFHLPEP
jgi:hypothetical protein